MAVHFHTLKVSNIVKETDQCISVSFEVPPQSKEDFYFIEGQNITLKKIIDGEEYRRSYSLCAAPYEQQLKVAIKKVEQGKFSLWANQHLKIGDEIEVLPASGKFNLKKSSADGANYLAIAAGSGITPVMSIIKQALYQNPNNRITLIYGNRNRAAIIFFEELEALKNKFMQRFNLIHILSREKTEIDLHNGRVDEAKLTALGQILNFKSFDEALLCGPEEMIFSAEKFLLQQQMTKENIHYELFTAPGQKAILSNSLPTETTTDNKSHISIKVDGRTFQFSLGSQEESVLNAALKQGADLPFACKAGVCCTCKALLLEGEVRMDANYALEEEEVKQGYILTCQSHPVSKQVVIDFDVK